MTPRKSPQVPPPEPEGEEGHRYVYASETGVGSASTGAPTDFVYRERNGSWWCPNCDNSQPLAQPDCLNCGWDRP